ncbi:OPT/YSL family transporter [Fictibacillus sp. FJAT-27399]|uniref:OPT/YSL family transporter n=1 Tax=Fictibacillus sp. FJAT-27399 TaxID=1729689 RepID=UPI000783F514|nr:OPT/YSL family transporter [Fictibacillus sp. FJAT-27399]
MKKQNEELKEKKNHPKATDPFTLFLTIATAVIGAIIGLQLIVTLGISANTAIIGALLAMVISRIPIRVLNKYRSVHRQNLIQTSISSATFGAANSLMIPIGIPFIMGETGLILPMLIGAALAMLLDATILYKLFDTKIFPASETWPPGVATAESIVAGDQGGKRAGLLGIGAAGGIFGSFLGVPMSAFGVAFIGNIWAITMFGIGLLLRAYSGPLFGVDLNKSYIPHGFMIGAGLVALIQVALIIFKKNKSVNVSKKEIAASVDSPIPDETRTDKDISKAFGYGFLAYLAVAFILAIMGGILTDMSLGMFIIYLLFASFAAFVHEIIVGIAAMHSGWFPAFAVALITLIIGMLIGFPPVALGLLVGFSAATGPAFADMGYDLKTGYMLRGNGKDREFELSGRKQQYITSMIAFVVATLVVFFAYNSYFAQNLVAPVDKVYVATIEAGVSKHIAWELFLWAIPGALLQFFGGTKRQMGVLFATGLLIFYPMAGWAVIAGILIRVIVLKVKGQQAETPMSILAAGFIAGDALYSFFSSIFKISK